MFLEHFGNVRMVRGTLKQHVFQQVGHAGFAVAFVSGTDEDRHVDGHLRFRGIRKQQDADAVFEPVFRDSLDRSHNLRFGPDGGAN